LEGLFKFCKNSEIEALYSERINNDVVTRKKEAELESGKRLNFCGSEATFVN